MKFTRPQIRVLCALTLAYTCGYICRTHISMLLPSLMEAFSLTQAQGGLIATLFAVVYACGQLVVGAGGGSRESARLYPERVGDRQRRQFWLLSGALL